MGTGHTGSGIRIVAARVRNFRALQQVDVSLGDLTVLVGENNAGKTSFIEALYAAIGAGRRTMSEDDVFLAPTEKRAPKNRVVAIDLLIRPTDDGGLTVPSFPTGYWLALWGNGVSQDDADNDFVAIRTRMAWDNTQGEYVVERVFLGDWQTDPGKWELSKAKGPVSYAQIEPLALYLMDAKRDIQDEFSSRSSFWHKLVYDPGLTDDQIEEMEKILSQVNERILSYSDVLSHVQDHLDELYDTINCEPGSVSISPVARHLRDMNRGVDVAIATRGAQSFPLVRQGMGTRSLTAVLVFRAYTSWRQKCAKSSLIHPMLALEEPETHLHPQAQRALFRLVSRITGQRIISTHSPYIAGQAPIDSLRHFRKVGPCTEVTSIDISQLSDDDRRKIERMVLNTRGDLIYARALVICSGETEEQALPVFGAKYWGRQPNDLGITMVGVGGDGSYVPFLRLAHQFAIPWYIFSDGEKSAIDSVNRAMEVVGEPLTSPRLFIIPDGKSFEKYVATNESQDALINMAISLDAVNDFHKKALKKEWDSKGDPLSELVLYLEHNKTRYARPLAEAITELLQEELRFPM